MPKKKEEVNLYNCSKIEVRKRNKFTFVESQCSDVNDTFDQTDVILPKAKINISNRVKSKIKSNQNEYIPKSSKLLKINIKKNLIKITGQNKKRKGVQEEEGNFQNGKFII